MLTQCPFRIVFEHVVLKWGVDTFAGDIFFHFLSWNMVLGFGCPSAISAHPTRAVISPIVTGRVVLDLLANWYGIIG